MMKGVYVAYAVVAWYVAASHSPNRDILAAA